jgi:2-amino-4-hydroxy-6-hydroxymethyldihydropteridine diphosphokinase
MPEVLIALGSNFEPVPALRLAVRALETRFGTVACSSVYRSAAVGSSAPDYLNLVARMATQVDADELRIALATIENEAGRTRTDPRVCRLDLDLLVYGECVDAARRLPRPGMFLQPFVVVPLAQLAPDLVHPLTGERCRAALAALRAASEVTNLGPLTALRV